MARRATGSFLLPSVISSVLYTSVYVFAPLSFFQAVKKNLAFADVVESDSRHSDTTRVDSQRSVDGSVVNWRVCG